MNNLSSDHIKKLQSSLDPVVAETLDDIRRIIHPFIGTDTDKKSVQFKCRIKWSTEKESGEDEVNGISNDSTIYRLLIDGLNLVKKHMEVTEKANQLYARDDIELPLHNQDIWDVDKMRFNVDNLISRRLGGQRNKLRVRWVVSEGCYEFDPFEKKLYKID